MGLGFGKLSSVAGELHPPQPAPPRAVTPCPCSISDDSRWAEAGISLAASFPAAGPYDLKTTEVEAKLSNPNAVERPAYTLYLAYSCGNFDVIFIDDFSRSSQRHTTPPPHTPCSTLCQF